MGTQNNVVCLDIEFGNDVEPEHIYNIEIISKNLEDFNRRFEMDIMLSYDVDDYMFSPLQENEEYAVWFCEDINELLAFADSPTCNDPFDLDQYISKRKKEINYLHSIELFNQYCKRYWDYAPIGFLSPESMEYIKKELNRILTEKSKY